MVLDGNLKGAINAAIEMPSGENRNDLFMLMGSLNHNDRNERMGLLSPDDVRRENNRIRAAFLRYVDNIPETTSVQDELRGYVISNKFGDLFVRISQLGLENDFYHTLLKEFHTNAYRTDAHFSDRLLLMVSSLPYQTNTVTVIHTGSGDNIAGNKIVNVGNNSVIYQGVSGSNITINQPKQQQPMITTNLASKKRELLLIGSERTAPKEVKEKANEFDGRIVTYQNAKLLNKDYDASARVLKSLVKAIDEFLETYQDTAVENKAAKYQSLIAKLGDGIPELQDLKDVFIKCRLLGYTNPDMYEALTSKKLVLDGDILAEYADALCEFLNNKINGLG